MHIYIISIVTMLNALSSDTLCLSRGGQGPLLSFPCPSFSQSSEKSACFFSPVGTSTLYQPPFGMWVLLLLTNEVRLSVKCIFAISISSAASHQCWGSLA